MCCKPSGDYTICRKHTWNGFLSPLRDFIVCLETRGWWWLLWEWRCCRCMWVAAVCLTLITANSRHSKTRYMALHLVMKGGHFIPRLTNTKALWSMVRVQRPHLVFDFDWYWMIWAQGQRTTPLFRLDWLQRPATHQMTSGYSIK